MGKNKKMIKMYYKYTHNKMATRKACINVPTASFSGKEQSPLRFGLSAEGYDIDTIMQGYDQMAWIVKMKNNKKVWVRQNTGPCTKTMVHEEPVIVTTPETNSEHANASDHINVHNDEKKSLQHIDTETIPIVCPPPIMKAEVQEKKLTDYNIYLSYTLYNLKKENTEKKTNKELLNKAIADWKILKKSPSELSKIMEEAHRFSKFQQM